MPDRRKPDENNENDADIPPNAMPSNSRLDRHSGNQMRKRRLELGHTTEALGKMLGDGGGGLVEMNERGDVRIPPDRLIRIAKVLDVPLPYFFDL